MLINVCDLDLEARTLEGETCTLVTAKTSNDIALRSFIRAGADVSAVNVAGQTPLHVVRDYKCSVLLLAAGADLNARDREGRTAFQLALRWNWSSILPAFLAAGADPSIVDVLDKRVLRSLDVDRVETARRRHCEERDSTWCGSAQFRFALDFNRSSLDALQMCEILLHSCGPVAHLIAFHQWWTLATAAKHFHQNSIFD
jgi:hypothetical protein